MNKRNKIATAVLLAIYAGLLLILKWEYLPKSILALTGILSLPFLTRQSSKLPSARYIWLGLTLAVLAVIYPSQMLFWFACGFAAMAVIETFQGRINYLPFYLMVVISPVFRYISDVWSFPIRLKMSELAAQSLNFIGFDAKSSGNVIVLDGNDFHVDPACMGLHSLSTGLLLTLLLLAYFERKFNRQTGFLVLGAWMALALCLAIAANFMRMLALVIFKVAPSDPMHDGWGLFSLLAYVLVPMFFLLKWRFTTNNQPPTAPIETTKKPITNGMKWLVNALIITLLFIADWRFDKLMASPTDIAPQVQLADFQRTVQKDGVLKFENDSLLVYLKPPVSWLNASHDPRICWQGSGYEFKHIVKEKIADMEVYTATLENGTDLLFTAWWYTTGTTTVLDEWTWRWSGVFGSGQGYWLVNVTASNSDLLKNKLPLIAAESRAVVAEH